VATDLGPILQRVDSATGEITGTWVVSDQGAINANQLVVEADGAFWFPLLDAGEVIAVKIPS
jgi:streptogramin lyase